MMIDPARMQFLFDECFGKAPEEWDSILKDEPDEIRIVLLGQLRGAEIPDDFDDEPVSPGRTGAVLGKYEIGSRLGEGGMGEVYRARLRSEAKDGPWNLVIKFIKHEASTDYREFFERECSALAQLVHDRIARFKGAERVDGQPFLVMEYVAGIRITDFCKTMTVRQIVQLFLDVCEPVHFAHLRLIQHRDLHPGNVLVTPEGNVKIIDFGLAKLTDDSATATQWRPYAYPYASPEHVAAERTDSRTDVYALGALLYELLTKRPILPDPLPESGQGWRPVLTERKRRLMIKTTEPLAASQATTSSKAAAQLRGDLDGILRKALQKDRDNRYESVQELRDDLERFLVGEPVHAIEPSLLYRAHKYVRKHRLPIAALGLAAAIGIWRGHLAASAFAKTRTSADTADELVYLTGAMAQNRPLVRLFETGTLHGPELAARVAAQQRFLSRIASEDSWHLAGLTPELTFSWLHLGRMHQALGAAAACHAASSKARFYSQRAASYYPADRWRWQRVQQTAEELAAECAGRSK